MSCLRYLPAGAVAAVTALTLAAGPAAADPLSGVEVYCAGDTANGLVRLGCVTPTEQNPANQRCRTIGPADQGTIADTLRVLGITVQDPHVIAGLDCDPVQPPAPA